MCGVFRFYFLERLKLLDRCPFVLGDAVRVRATVLDEQPLHIQRVITSGGLTNKRTFDYSPMISVLDLKPLFARIVALSRFRLSLSDLIHL